MSLASLLLIVFTLSWFAGFNLGFNSENHFILFAKSLLRGTFNIDAGTANSMADFVNYRNTYHLTAGPLTPIIFVPFVLIFGAGFNQGYVGFLFNLLNFFLLWRIAGRTGIKNFNHQALAASVFLLGSIYIGVSTSLYTAWLTQIIGVSLVLLAINEYLSQKRWWLIGGFLALSALARFMLFGAAIFFLLLFIKEKRHYFDSTWRRKAAQLIFPLLLAAVLWAGYNFIRFGDIKEFGYKYQIIPTELASLREQGLLSVRHILRNLYYSFLKTPEITSSSFRISPWGLSILLTSPYLLFLFFSLRNNPYTRYALITAVIMLVPISLMYFNGYVQYGFRYSLDFFPFLFLAFLTQQNGSFSPAVRCVLFASIAFNIFAFFAFLVTLSS